MAAMNIATTELNGSSSSYESFDCSVGDKFIVAISTPIDATNAT